MKYLAIKFCEFQMRKNSTDTTIEYYCYMVDIRDDLKHNWTWFDVLKGAYDRRDYMSFYKED